MYLLIPNKIVALKKDIRKNIQMNEYVKSMYESAYSTIASAGNEELLVVFQTFLWCHCQVMNDVVRTELLQANREQRMKRKFNARKLDQHARLVQCSAVN